MTRQQIAAVRTALSAWCGRLYFVARRRLARGRVRSRYWAPRIGDRVRLDGEGTWLVYGVSLRKRVVQLGRPGVVALDRVSACTRADLERHYNMDLDHKNRPVYRAGLTVPRFTNVDENGEPEPPAKFTPLHAVPDLEPEAARAIEPADDEHRQDPSA